MLTKSCEILPGVGPTLVKKLAKCGIYTVRDLLFHLPYRYQDRTRITPIQDLRINDWCVIAGRISKTEIKYGKRPMLSCYVDDKTGLLKLRFFHFNKQQIQRLNSGTKIRAFGEIREFASHYEMIHPEYQLLEEDNEYTVEETLTPIYSTTQGLSQHRLRQMVKQALTLCQNEINTLEWMNDEQLQHYQFQSLPQALACLHNPPPDTCVQLFEAGKHPALQRLAFDELLARRLSMQFAKQQRARLKAPPLKPNHSFKTSLLDSLPFTLTAAQQRVSKEIEQDLSKFVPMLRLVQGDVGSGKTVIAALAAIQTIANGYQVAFMAPTEILSEQHAQTLLPWFSSLAISVRRLSGKMKEKERKETLAALAQHQCQIIIGTHALFQDGVQFSRLGLVIIDEQHRFGVEQRLSLQQKGQSASKTPHQLLMTATPIPRTLAMTQFAHLDLSTLDELPPGRTPVITTLLHQEKRQLIISRLQKAIADGRQAYWVCTLIEDSEKLQCMAAMATAQNLREQLPNIRIGLVHGRMKTDEKEEVMAAFKYGKLDLLVATTVIEVGVDVANASLMIIENAERLGLSQLHQLRGRVGRGRNQAYCLLLYQTPLSTIGKERLCIMRATCDGFLIAEKDLQLRGAGEVLGTRQTGYHPFKIANLQRDNTILSSVADAANQLTTKKPDIAHTIAERWLGHFELFLQG
ncbi:ATP-dependent DNA helicase RecG [Legionella nagasakiensis]|uniref:ATP-dependent DNA helicase RecG n=1 Tax=Legionella nagasakiensis TaxID=535290 RepID=UPI001055B0CE|nr:ATP-dependent DNA helicase RecG [Legionella nagasakiensis]